MRYGYSQVASEREAAEQRNRMAVTWAAGTLRKLDVPFEASDGYWDVCTPWGWDTALNASDLSDIARGCLEHKLACDAVEGPVMP